MNDLAIVGLSAVAKRKQALHKTRAAKRLAKPAVDLKEENATLKRELAQALEKQSATSDVLKIRSFSVIPRGFVGVTRQRQITEHVGFWTHGWSALRQPATRDGCRCAIARK